MEIALGAFIFLAALPFLIYAPGRLVLLLLKISPPPLERVTLSLVLGLIVSGVVYCLFGYGGWFGGFFLWPIGATIAVLYLQRDTAGVFLRQLHPSSLFARLKAGGCHLPLIAVLLLGIVPLALLPQYYANLTWTGTGGLRDYSTGDVFLHLSIANELTHSIPPQAPLFAGYPLSYHFGNDLPVAMFARATGINTRDLTLRFVPTLFLMVSMLSAFCFSRKWLNSANFAALFTFLLFFGEDFSFVPGLLVGEKGDWSYLFFQVPSVFSLFYINPALPGVGLLFAGLFALLTYLRDRQTGWLFLAAMIFAALVEVKVFAAAQILGSLGVAAGVYWIFFRDARLVKLAAIILVLALPLVLTVLVHNRESAQWSLQFGPSSYVAVAMRKMSLEIRSHDLLEFIGIALPLYLLGSLGARVLGAGLIVQAFFRPRRDHPLRFVLAVFVVAGIAITLTCRVLPRDAKNAFDNGGWFFVQSKYVGWIFVVEFFQHWHRRLVSRGWTPAPLGVALAVLAAALSVPSTIQHFYLLIRGERQLESSIFTAERVKTAEFIAQDANPGDVVLCGGQMDIPVLSLTQCRVPVGIFAETLVPYSVYQARVARQQAFWDGWTAGRVRVDILKELAVRYLTMARKEGALPALLPPELVNVYSNSAFVVFKLRSVK